MKELKIASANLEHWIAAGGTLISGRQRVQKDFDSKLAWAQALFRASTPTVAALQEVYDESVEKVFAGLGDFHFHYSSGAQQQVAIATTLPLAPGVDAVTPIQALASPIKVEREGLSLEVNKTSRPILRVRLVHEEETITVFAAHLKSKIPSYGDDPTVTYEEERLLTADFARRPLGNLVSLVRRAAEAAALRREVIAEMTAFPDRPVIVCGDLNDAAGAVTTDMILGDSMRTFIKGKNNLSENELKTVYGRLHQFMLTSAQDSFVRQSALSEFYTAIYEGRLSTLDHIFLSRHFFGRPRMAPEPFVQKYYFNYFEVANDHLVDDGSAFAPRKPETTDHGVVFAHCRKVTSSPSPGPNQLSDYSPI